jgi:hypothetical protein
LLIGERTEQIVHKRREVGPIHVAVGISHHSSDGETVPPARGEGVTL